MKRIRFVPPVPPSGLELEGAVRDGLEQWYGLGAPDLLAQSAGGVSLGKVRRLVDQGRVLVEGRSCRQRMRRLRPGEVVEVLFDPTDFLEEKAARDRPFVMDETAVLYRDPYLLAVSKPPGIPVEPGRVAGRPHLLGLVRDYVGAEVWLQHRLDRDTTGILLFALDPAMNADLHRQFEEHRVRKVYHALAWAGPDGEWSGRRGGARDGGQGGLRDGRKPAQLEIGASWSVDNFLGRVSASSAAARWGPMDQGEGGKVARTRFLLRAVAGAWRYLQAEPETGRTHQIRVHAALGGLPLVGDGLYGGEVAGTQAARIMLHAWRLGLDHPATGKPLEMVAPPPEDFAVLARERGLGAGLP